MIGRLPLAVIAASAMTLPFAPAAVANDRQAVITESGKVRCYTNATGGGHGGGSSVVCQRRGGEPFAQSPYSVEERSRLNLAAVSENGDFYWDIGNIPWSQEAIADDIVLKYGQTYHVNGWTILSTFEGTRFTNDRTGHGMFVSVDDVYGF